MSSAMFNLILEATLDTLYMVAVSGVIAALVGAALLGVVGALLAIPTAAAILMLVREVFIRRQDAA